MKIKIKEAEDDLMSQLKGEVGDLIDDIEDTLEDKTQEQQEGVLTVAGAALAVPAVLGLISRFGRKVSALVKSDKTKQSDSEKYFMQMGRIADELHHLYMKPLELMMRKFIKDEAKAKKVAHFVFHVIVAIMLISAGVTAFKAIQAKSISLATLESALAAIKGGEIKQYITKLLM